MAGPRKRELSNKRTTIEGARLGAAPGRQRKLSLTDQKLLLHVCSSSSGVPAAAAFWRAKIQIFFAYPYSISTSYPAAIRECNAEAPRGVRYWFYPRTGDRVSTKYSFGLFLIEHLGGGKPA